MKKYITSFMGVIFILALTLYNTASADSRYILSSNFFILPSSLDKIEAEAFEGTAVRTVVFQDGLCSIGDLVFAESHNLSDVYIPSSIEYIGKNAFPSNIKLTIHGVIGSLAEKWAKEHQVPFVPSNIWNVVNNGRDTHQYIKISVNMFFQAIDYERNNHLHGRTEDEGKSMRPQDRSELNPIDYRFP